MLNKKVLLGALVAGAMVLPMSASAGVVSGQCVTCHTMHNSQNGANMGNASPQGTLLRGGGCEGCHAAGTNDANGVSVPNFSAPQVHDASNPNLAGFFTAGATANNHNLPGELTGAVADPFPSAPGGGTTNVVCAGCHIQSSGGHHGQGGASYRMLFTITGTDQTADSIFGNANASNGTVDVSGTTYDSDEMNAVCNRCHGDFHGAAEQLSGTSWIRHPTDLSLAAALTQTNYDYSGNYTNNANANITPLGTSTSTVTGTGGADMLMCITCHFSHGSGQPDLLRFAYNASANLAGDNSASVGCESCHDYSSNAGGIVQQGM